MVVICLAIFIICSILMLKNTFNRIFVSGYTTCGVDVSEYQGKIDWDTLHRENVTFAFIKATEGSSYVDPYFSDNWISAHDSGIIPGAYHFFSFDSKAETQAENFISVVPCAENSLPPVIDIEFYGKYRRAHPPNRDLVISELKYLLDCFESTYGKKPIIYATVSTYREYISGHFDDYPLWIRSVYVPAPFFVGNRWIFWQYSDKAKLSGYSGPEAHIDMNVFNGTYEELFALSQ